MYELFDTPCAYREKGGLTPCFRASELPNTINIYATTVFYNTHQAQAETLKHNKQLQPPPSKGQVRDLPP